MLFLLLIYQWWKMMIFCKQYIIFIFIIVCYKMSIIDSYICISENVKFFQYLWNESSSLWLENYNQTFFFRFYYKKKIQNYDYRLLLHYICIILNQTILIIVKGEQREGNHGHWWMGEKEKNRREEGKSYR